MTTAELLATVKAELNVPQDDDLFSDEELWLHLRNAEEQIIGEVGLHHPELLSAETLLTPTTTSGSDAYRYYDLKTAAGAPVHPAPSFELWTPPGRNRGLQVFPKDPGMGREGFLMRCVADSTGAFTGTRLELDPPTAYSPGLYLWWTRLAGQVAVDVVSLLPAWMHEYLCLLAAAKAARKPYSGLDRERIQRHAAELWEGDMVSAGGLLGRLKRMAGGYGVQTVEGGGPWWRGIRGG